MLINCLLNIHFLIKKEKQQSPLSCDLQESPANTDTQFFKIGSSQLLSGFISWCSVHPLVTHIQNVHAVNFQRGQN